MVVDTTTVVGAGTVTVDGVSAVVVVGTVVVTVVVVPVVVGPGVGVDGVVGTVVGGTGGGVAVTGALHGPTPLELTAATSHSYGVPDCNPVTVRDVPSPLAG